MITYKDFILVKGKYYDISVPFDVTGFTGFNCELFTNSAIKITPANIAFDDGKVIITFNPENLDDGVLYYEFTYYVDNVLQIKCTNTPYVIRTPEGYSAQTVDEIYASGETAGAEAQKALLTGATITENGEYVRPDGYSAVTVNVPTSSGSNVDVITTAVTVTGNSETIESESGKAWSAVTIDAEQFGTNKYNDGYASGYTDGSALVPTISAMSYTFVTNDDLVKTFSAETGTAWSAVTIDATEKFRDGYYIAVEDLENGAVELSLSANGIYNADIQQRTRGYIKKVIVNVSGGTQEPFFGKVADMTGVGWLMDNIADSTLFEFEFICPNLSGYQNQNLYIASWDDNDENLRCEYYAYDSDTKLKLDSDSTGDDFNINSINNKSVLTKLYKTSGKIDVNVIVPGAVWTTSGDSQCSRNQICFFAMNFWGVQPGELPRYFKSFRVFDVQNNNELLHIVPRSDGKMWDLVANQEATIDWLKYDGTHPTTFNTLYEWEIPQ